MDKNIERQVVAFINNSFLVKEKTQKYSTPNPYVVAICYELATNFKILLDSDLVGCISEEEAIEYYDTIKYLVDLKTEGRKMLLQPYFPDLIKVAQPNSYERLASICEERTKIDNLYNISPTRFNIRTHEELKDYILSKKTKDKYDFIYLGSFTNWPRLEYILYYVYSTRSYYPIIKPTENLNYDTINLRLTREDRKYILENLNNPEYKPSDIDMSNIRFWNKLTKVLHPEEPKYKRDYPEAYRLLMGIRGLSSSTSQKPKGKKNCPKLHNIMTAAWKKGEEFEALDFWMSRDDISLREILEEIRHYEVSPRIDPFRRFGIYEKKKGRVLKKLKERVIGNKIPSDFDQEIAGEIKLSLKQKFLGKLPNTGQGNYEIPEKFKKIPATYILKGRLKFTEPIDAEKIRIVMNKVSYNSKLSAVLGDKDSNYVSTLDYLRFRRTDLINGRERCGFENLIITGIGNGKILDEGYNKLIVLHDSLDHEDNKLSVTDYKTNGIILAGEKVGNSVIAFIVDLETNLLYWVNESTKYFYNGNLSQIGTDNFDYIVKLFCNPKTSEPEFLSLYDVCEKYYGASVPGKEVLNEYKVLHDIETIL